MVCVMAGKVLGGVRSGRSQAVNQASRSDTDEKEETRLSWRRAIWTRDSQCRGLKKVCAWCVPATARALVKLQWHRSQGGQQEADSSRGSGGHIMSDLSCKAFCSAEWKEGPLENVWGALFWCSVWKWLQGDGTERCNPRKRSRDFSLFFWPHHVASGILVPQPGAEPAPPALEVRSLNHWTTRQVPQRIPWQRGRENSKVGG